jgi:hypothetical protein
MMQFYYHSPCLDGLASAYAASLAHPLGTFTPYDPNRPLASPCAPNIQTVYFLDCAPTPALLASLLQQNVQVRILDHHEGNIRELPKEHTTLCSTEQSGCMLAWHHFFPDLPIPTLLTLIGKRDLGRFTGPDYVGFALMNRNPRTVDDMSKLVSAVEFHHLDLEEEGILFEAEVDAAEAGLELIPFVLNGRPIHYAKVSTHKYISELARRLLPRYHVLCFYQESSDGYTLSFRTNGSVDAIGLAKVFGGGGHPQAAGAKVAEFPFKS